MASLTLRKRRAGTATVTIANNGTVSTAGDMNGAVLAAVIIPAEFTGSAITFQASVDGETFYDVVASGSAYSVSVTAGDYHAVEHANFLGANYIKVVSGSAEGAERTVTLVGWDVN